MMEWIITYFIIYVVWLLTMRYQHHLGEYTFDARDFFLALLWPLILGTVLLLEADQALRRLAQKIRRNK